MKLLCRCPHCNGLFEAADYSEKNVICRWCGKDVGVAEYVETDFNEREFLDGLLADRQKLEEEVSVDAPSLVNRIAVPALLTVPVVLVLYKLATGGNIAWYLWVLAGLGVLTLCSLPGMIRQTNRVYESLKELIVRKGYSLEGIADEIGPLKARAAEIREEQSSEADVLEALAEALEKLIPYAYSQVEVREHYAAGDSRGVRAQPQAAPANASAESPVVTAMPAESDSTQTPASAGSYPQQERLVYIRPPQRCPACNHIYTTRELAGKRVVCPDCGLEFDLLDEHARTEVQAMVRQFFAKDKNLQAKTSYKYALGIGLVLLAICVGSMVSRGIEEFFFSGWVVLLMVAVLLVASVIQSMLAQRAIAREISEGMNDLFELEVFVRARSPFLKDDFVALKAEIVKKLKKEN